MYNNTYVHVCTVVVAPVPHKAVDDVSVMNIHNQYRVELLTVIFRQLRTNLNTNITQIYHTVYNQHHTVSVSVCDVQVHMHYVMPGHERPLASPQ